MKQKSTMLTKAVSQPYRLISTIAELFKWPQTTLGPLTIGKELRNAKLVIQEHALRMDENDDAVVVDDLIRIAKEDVLNNDFYKDKINTITTLNTFIVQKLRRKAQTTVPPEIAEYLESL